MVVTDEKRLLSWLSQLHEAEPVILQNDSQPTARFIFDGIPIEKQDLDANLIFQKRSPRASRWQQARFELEDFEQPHLSRPTTKGTEFGISRIEKNEYKRLPRAKTKEDRYEYKGKSSVTRDRSTTARARKPPRQKRKHTINEDFQASNVQSTRLTLHSTTKLGIFNKGKRSYPVNTRVLDQGFSETEFLSETPIHLQANALLQHESKTNFFEFDFGIENTSRAQSKIGVKELRQETEGTLQQQPPSENITMNFSDTSIRHVADNSPEKETEADPGQLFCCGREQKGPSDKLSIYPPMEQNSRSVADLVAESSTMKLLDFNMNLLNENVTADPAKNYWTLEDLKNIMQQRVSSWKSDDEGSTTPDSRVQTGSRKRKDILPQEKENTHAKLSKRRRTQGYSQRFEINLRDRSTSPRTAALGHCSFSGSCIDLPLGKPLPAHGQIGHAMEGNSFQPQRPCPDRGVGFIYDEDASFISQAFDAAYEAIMWSEPEAPFNLPDLVPMNKVTTRNNDGNVPLQVPWEWDLKDEETLNLSHIRQETLLPHQERSGTAIYMTPSRNYERQRSYFGELCANQEALLPINKVSSMDSGQVREWKRPKVNKLDFVTIDPMKNFWRQNKLY